MKLRMPWVVVIGICLLILTRQASAGMTIDRTFSIAGSTGWNVRGINDNGTIVGSFTDNNNVNHGYLLSSCDSLTCVDVAGASHTFLSATNNLDQLTGDCVINGVDSKFVMSGTSITWLNKPDAAAVVPLGINDGGQVVGSLYDQSYNNSGFSLLGSNYSLINCPDPATTATIATAVNNHGDITGFYQVGQQSVGYLLCHGNLTSFSVAGSSSVIPTGIDVLGNIVGNYLDDDGCQHSFLRATDSTLYSIDVAGAMNTSVQGINNLGQVVGSFSTAEGTGASFVGTPELTTLLTSGSLATPEPSTIWTGLLAVGAILLRVRSRRA
jgi:hypothetical protein